jgi:hypothetical protein
MATLPPLWMVQLISIKNVKIGLLENFHYNTVVGIQYHLLVVSIFGSKVHGSLKQCILSLQLKA